MLAWKAVLPIWWSFVWRSVLYGAVGGLISGAIAGAIAGSTGHLDKARLSGSIAGYVAGFCLSVPAFKQSLQKHISRLQSVRADTI
jgi:hypothetical protein